MIWTLIILSLGLASARKREYVTPEHLNHLRATGQDEEFARLLGVDVSLIRVDKEGRSEGSIFNHVSPLGDMLLPEVEEEDEEGRQVIRFDKWPGSRWPNGQIPVAFSDSFTDEQLRFIITALVDWNEKVDNLKIVRYTGQKDYVYVIDASGCWSYLGRTGGQQALSLQSNGCFTNGTVQHEFMHAAGCTHEHNRYDRDEFVDVLWGNIPEDWHSQYFKNNEDDYMNIGDYGYDSVMHYPIWSPGTYEDAFYIKREGVDRNSLGQRVGMSGNDIYKVNTLYKK